MAPAPPASPHPAAPTSRSSTPARAVASTTRARFLRGSSVPTASTYSPSGGSPSRRKTGSSAFGTTSMRSGSTPASSMTSRFENSETANTRSTARSVGRQRRAAVEPRPAGKTSGWRRTARSCTVRIVGTRERGGARKMVQWSTSTEARRPRAGARRGTRARPRRRPSAAPRRPTRAARRRRRRAPRARARSPLTHRAVPARVWRSGATSSPTLTPRPPRTPAGGSRRTGAT